MQDLREAEFSRLLIDRADDSLVAADASKFGRNAPIAVAPPARFAYLITDAAPDAALASFLAAPGTRVTLS